MWKVGRARRRCYPESPWKPWRAFGLSVARGDDVNAPSPGTRSSGGRAEEMDSRALASTWSHLPCTCLIRCHQFCRRQIFSREPQTSCNHTSHALSTAVHLFLALPQARNRKAPRGENAYSRSHSVSPALGFIALVPWSWMLLLLLVSCVSVSLSTPSLQSVGPRGNFQATYPFHPCHPSHCVSSGIVCAISCRTLDRIGTLAMTPRPPLTKVCPLDQRQDTPGNHTQQSHALV